MHVVRHGRAPRLGVDHLGLRLFRWLALIVVKQQVLLWHWRRPVFLLEVDLLTELTLGLELVVVRSHVVTQRTGQCQVLRARIKDDSDLLAVGCADIERPNVEGVVFAFEIDAQSLLVFQVQADLGRDCQHVFGLGSDEVVFGRRCSVMLTVGVTSTILVAFLVGFQI